MNCKRFRDVFDPSLAASAEVVEHLQRCLPCRAYADEMQKLQVLLTSFPTIPVPSNFDAELSAKLAEVHARQIIGRQGIFKRSFALAASILVALALGALYVRHQRSVMLPPESRRRIAGMAPEVNEAGQEVEKATESQPKSSPTAPSGHTLYADANLQRQVAPAADVLLPAGSRAQTVRLTGESALARRLTAADAGVVLLLRDEESQEETLVAIPPLVFGSRPLIPTMSKLASTDKRGVL